MNRVIAFDPGFERLGVAVIEKENGREKLLYSTCLRSAATLPFPERLNQLGCAVELLLDEWVPSAAALEDLYFAKNAKTAMQVAEARGMLIYLIAHRGIPVFHYTPLQVKVAITGHGRSDKRAVTLMVHRLLPIPQGKRLDDELDAIAVGLSHLASVRAYPQK